MLGKVAKRYAVLAIVVPLAAAGARRLSEAMEKRRGPSRATRLLRQGADLVQQRNSKRSRFGRW